YSHSLKLLWKRSPKAGRVPSGKPPRAKSTPSLEQVGGNANEMQGKGYSHSLKLLWKRSPKAGRVPSGKPPRAKSTPSLEQVGGNANEMQGKGEAVPTVPERNE
ncbi:Hypothetical predicted protein, partial [Marmota monax]